ERTAHVTQAERALKRQERELASSILAERDEGVVANLSHAARELDAKVRAAQVRIVALHVAPRVREPLVDLVRSYGSHFHRFLPRGMGGEKSVTDGGHTSAISSAWCLARGASHAKSSSALVTCDPHIRPRASPN